MLRCVLCGSVIAKAADIRRVVPPGQYGGFEAIETVAARLQMRVARVIMIPGEPMWGMTVTPTPYARCSRASTRGVATAVTSQSFH